MFSWFHPTSHFLSEVFASPPPFCGSQALHHFEVSWAFSNFLKLSYTFSNFLRIFKFHELSQTFSHFLKLSIHLSFFLVVSNFHELSQLGAKVRFHKFSVTKIRTIVKVGRSTSCFVSGQFLHGSCCALFMFCVKTCLGSCTYFKNLKQCVLPKDAISCSVFFTCTAALFWSCSASRRSGGSCRIKSHESQTASSQRARYPAAVGAETYAYHPAFYTSCIVE